jgi:hypothetical protein
MIKGLRAGGSGALATTGALGQARSKTPENPRTGRRRCLDEAVMRLIGLPR